MMLAENIKNFRLKMKLTQEELAKRLNISPQSVSKWERSESLPDAAILPDLADTLGVSLDRLFSRESTSFEDAGYMILRYLKSLPESGQMEAVRKLAYFCEESVFSDPEDPHVIEYRENREWDPENVCKSSCNETEYGFTFDSGREELPFFSIFIEPEDGWGKLLCQIDRLSRFFSDLSDRDVLETLNKILRLPDGFSFDSDFAAKEFGLNEPEKILGKIEMLRVLRAESIVIDKKPVKIWFYTRRCGIIAILSLVDEFLFHNYAFELQSCSRRSPYIR